MSTACTKKNNSSVKLYPYYDNEPGNDSSAKRGGVGARRVMRWPATAAPNTARGFQPTDLHSTHLRRVIRHPQAGCPTSNGIHPSHRPGTSTNLVACVMPISEVK